MSESDTKQIGEEKINKINQIKDYLNSLNLNLKKALNESHSKMQEVVRKSEEEKIKKVLEDLKNM
jgi:ribosomal protein L7/L12